MTLFSDVVPDASVTVRDGDGAVLTIGRLGRGRYQEGAADTWCEFEFEVDDVPPADFYSVQIASRPERRYTAEELDRTNGRVTIEFTQAEGGRAF